MISFNEFISEARKNPELNPKTSINDLILQYHEKALLLPGSKIKNAFVSFTEIDKLGVNPKSKYNTPLGIYSYPTSYIINVINKHSSMGNLPFAGNSKYANIFSISGNILNLTSMKDSDLRKYIVKLEELYPIAKNAINDIFSASKYNAMFNTPGGEFWYITREFSMMAANDNRLSKSSSVPVIWNSLFRKLGIDGCMDTGRGIIHTAEPYQAVFFSPLVIKNVKRYYNKYSPETIEDNKYLENQMQDINAWVNSIMEKIRNNDTSYFHDIIKLLSGNYEYSRIEIDKRIERLLSNYSKLPKDLIHLIVFAKDEFHSNYGFIRFIKNPDEDLIMELIKNDSTLGLSIFKDIKSEKILLSILKISPAFIFNIKNPSETLQSAAISKDLSYIRYINNPTEKIQLLAVKEKPHLIKFIKNPSLRVQEAAVFESPEDDDKPLTYVNNTIIKKFLDQDPKNFKQLIDQELDNSEMIKYALEKHGNDVIQYMRSIPADMQKMLIEKDPSSAKLIFVYVDMPKDVYNFAKLKGAL